MTGGGRIGLPTVSRADGERRTSPSCGTGAGTIASKESVSGTVLPASSSTCRTRSGREVVLTWSDIEGPESSGPPLQSPADVDLLVADWPSSGRSFSEADEVHALSAWDDLLPCLMDTEFVGPAALSDEFLCLRD